MFLYPTADAREAACCPIFFLTSSVIAGDGASSITFWFLLWIEHSLSGK